VKVRARVGVVSTRGIGPERGGRVVNEDNYLIARDGAARFLRDGVEHTVDTPGPGLMVVVADGMGGHEHGSLASGAAVQAMARLVQAGRPVDPDLALHGFVVRAHRQLQLRARERGVGNMGTTLTAAWILGVRAHWVHVGDSRLWLVRDGVLMQLSRDHTRGEFAERDGRGLPLGPLALTQNFIFGSRGLGDDDGIRVDAGMDTGAVALQPGDRLLLTSDGVHGFLAAHGLEAAILPDADPGETARRIVEESIAAGSDDNITALVVSVDTVETPDPVH